MVNFTMHTLITDISNMADVGLEYTLNTSGCIDPKEIGSERLAKICYELLNSNKGVYTSKKETSHARVLTLYCRKVPYFILFFGDGLYSGEAVFQIGEDVVDVLRTDGETDGVLVDSRGVKLLVGEL